MKYYLHLSFPDCNLSLVLFQLILIRFFLHNRAVSHDHLKALPKFLFLKYTNPLTGSILARTVVTRHVRCTKSPCLLHERTLSHSHTPRAHVTRSQDMDWTINCFAELFIHVNSASPVTFNLIVLASRYEGVQNARRQSAAFSRTRFEMQLSIKLIFEIVTWEMLILSLCPSVKPWESTEKKKWQVGT